MRVLLVPNGLPDQDVQVRTSLERRGHEVTLPRLQSIDDMSPARRKNALEKFSSLLDAHSTVLVINGRMPRDRLSEYAFGCAVIASLRGIPVACLGDLPAAQSEELSQFGVTGIKGDLDGLERLNTPTGGR